MTFSRRLACLLLPVCLLACLSARPARPQVSNQDARFAFADTTLLRDTLGLTFERLFPLADSLRMAPAALKLLSVTYRWTLPRLVKMADSLDVPIDSVGPVMERERFNPLSGVVTSDRMTYTSTFTPRASGDSWSNDLDYTLSRGKAFLSNKMTIDLDENGRNGSLGTRETRDARTSLNWRLSQRFSAGAEASLHRFDNATRSGSNNEAERINNFGFQANARPKPWRGLSPSLNVLGGIETQDKLAEQKRGFSVSGNGSLRYNTGTWWSQDLNFSGRSALSQASAVDPNPDDLISYPEARARDHSATIRGTVNVLRGRPVEFNANFSTSNTRTQQPIAFDDTMITAGPSGLDTTLARFTNKQLVLSRRSSVDGTLRLRRGSTQNLDIGWKSGRNENANSTVVTSTNTREDRSLNVNGRIEAGPLLLTSTFNVGEGVNRFPRRDAKGGYQEDADSRNLQGSANWRLSPKLSAQLDASISLNVSRYSRIDSALSVPVAHDVANQEYRFNVKYDRSERVNTSIGLQVTRGQYVNLPAASTASNTDTRSYRASWSWTYRLLEGLTATQSNGLRADYTNYPFASSSNRLSLDYTTLTTLNAVFNRRLTVELTHNAQFQPSGNYRPQSPADPTEYFIRSDENLRYSLNARCLYTPAPSFSLNLSPEYVATDRNTSQNGVLSPQRTTRSLKISGGASLNVQVGSRGKLTGTVNRRVSADRTVNYGTSGPTIEPRRETRFIDGSMTFTWTM